MSTTIETFESIPEDEKMWIDFLPSIDSYNKTEMKILSVWKEFFKGKGVPYRVEKDGRILSLWKERRG